MNVTELKQPVLAWVKGTREPFPQIIYDFISPSDKSSILQRYDLTPEEVTVSSLNSLAARYPLTNKQF